MSPLHSSFLKKLVSANRVTQHSIHNNDVGASIVFALMQLHNIGICNKLGERERGDCIEVIKQGHLITYPPGTTIVQYGDTSDSLYIILEGNVIVQTPDGRSIYLEKGSLVGHMAALTEQPRNATVIAGDHLVAALVISKETLFANPSVYRCLLGNGLVIQGKTGSYELGQKLGEGMTSKVYALHDSRYCAKVYKNVLRFEGDYVAKFIAENFLDLKHPHIVNVYELIEAYGTHFLIMDRAHGVRLKKKTGEIALCLTLRHMLSVYAEQGERIPINLCTTMVADIGSALAHTHHHGYVHRDVKPENIFLDAREGTVVFLLADFGLALPIGATPNKIVGTPHYMAPEAIAIDTSATPLSGAADFYALAAVCFEMLTSKKLFTGATILEVLDQHCSAPPDLTLLPHDTPDNLREFIRSCLHKNPAERLSPEEVQTYVRQQ